MSVDIFLTRCPRWSNIQRRNAPISRATPRGIVGGAKVRVESGSKKMEATPKWKTS